MDWLPLVIAAVIGIIVGAIAAYVPLNRRGEEYQYRIRDLEGKLKTSGRDLEDVRGQTQTLQATLRNSEALLSDSQTKLTAAADEKTALESKIGEHTAALDALKATVAGLQTERDEAASKVAELETKLAAHRDQINAHVAEIHTYKANAQAMAEAFAKREEELNKTKFDLGVASSVKGDLESRLQRVRADVAAELALLTSTALKLKDEALGQANSRLSTLSAEIHALRSRDANAASAASAASAANAESDGSAI